MTLLHCWSKQDGFSEALREAHDEYSRWSERSCLVANIKPVIDCCSDRAPKCKAVSVIVIRALEALECPPNESQSQCRAELMQLHSLLQPVLSSKSAVKIRTFIIIIAVIVVLLVGAYIHSDRTKCH